MGLHSTLVLFRVTRKKESIVYRVSQVTESAMRLLAICWTAGWVVAGVYVAARKGRPLARAAIEALIFGPFVLLLLSFAKQSKKK